MRNMFFRFLVTISCIQLCFSVGGSCLAPPMFQEEKDAHATELLTAPSDQFINYIRATNKKYWDDMIKEIGYTRDALTRNADEDSSLSLEEDELQLYASALYPLLDKRTRGGFNPFYMFNRSIRDALEKIMAPYNFKSQWGHLSSGEKELLRSVYIQNILVASELYAAFRKRAKELAEEICYEIQGNTSRYRLWEMVRTVKDIEEQNSVKAGNSFLRFLRTQWGGEVIGSVARGLHTIVKDLTEYEAVAFLAELRRNPSELRRSYAQSSMNRFTVRYLKYLHGQIIDVVRDIEGRYPNLADHTPPIYTAYYCDRGNLRYFMNMRESSRYRWLPVSTAQHILNGGMNRILYDCHDNTRRQMVMFCIESLKAQQQAAWLQVFIPRGIIAASMQHSPNNWEQETKKASRLRQRRSAARSH